MSWVALSVFVFLSERANDDCVGFISALYSLSIINSLMNNEIVLPTPTQLCNCDQSDWTAFYWSFSDYGHLVIWKFALVEWESIERPLIIQIDVVPEWLRGVIRNHLRSACASSGLVDVAILLQILEVVSWRPTDSRYFVCSCELKWIFFCFLIYDFGVLRIYIWPPSMRWKKMTGRIPLKFLISWYCCRQLILFDIDFNLQH